MCHEYDDDDDGDDDNVLFVVCMHAIYNAQCWLVALARNID